MNVATKMLSDVERFHAEVLGMPARVLPGLLNSDRFAWAMAAMQEELGEFVEAHEKGDVVGAADALVDLVYFALGRIAEMGIPVGPVWDAVQSANMAKTRGELSKRPGSQGFDAVKPEGWLPPDHSWLLEMTRHDVENLRRRTARANMPPVKAVFEGQKFNVGKAPLSLVPREAIELEAQVFDYGRQKYAAWNWQKGRPVSELLDALLRHAYALADGEDLDPESGLHHIGHVRCCSSMAYGVLVRRPDLDDRRPA